MTYGLWLSTAGMQVNEYRQALSSNNLANAQTTGFKHDLSVVHERVMESNSSPGGRRFRDRTLDNMTGGPWVRPTIQTFQQGDLDRTERPLDLALYGKGFFTLKDGDELRYTRDGRFDINPNGDLVAVSGGSRFRVIDDGGEAIKIDPRNGAITVTQIGEIIQNDQAIARLGVAEFDDPNMLVKLGENVYKNHGSKPKKSASEIRAGHVEMSTANPINGLSDMIMISRAYEMNARLITLQDQTIGQAVSRLGRVG